ncbi:hypothetical protein CEXT_62941 [Caerostris extrusa]|uniref:Uncharacterized protein n=1 Tax=Caerostris extrusa TaxID=172846 RepID=A0AAV4XQB4_CAEEX|nr:hypothetical protein CEXT_62941 [Caerostris extrusa]
MREIYGGRHKSDAPKVKENNNNGVTEEKAKKKYIIMKSRRTVAEGREGGVNSKSFRTSERSNAPNLVTQDEPLLAVIKFVPPQVPKRN